MASSSVAGLRSPQMFSGRGASPGQTQARSPLSPAARSPATSGSGAGTSAPDSLSSGGKIRRDLAELGQADRREQHDHLNGVLPAPEFLRCLFDLDPASPADLNSDSMVTHVFTALRDGLTDIFSSKLGGLAPLEPRAGGDVATRWPKPNRLEKMGQVLRDFLEPVGAGPKAQLADLRARFAVLKKLLKAESSPLNEGPTKMDWILRCLAAHPQDEGSLLAIDFDWCYDARKILWQGVEPNNPPAVLGDHFIGKAGGADKLIKAIGQGEAVSIKDAETLLDPNAFKKNQRHHWKRSWQGFDVAGRQI